MRRILSGFFGLATLAAVAWVAWWFIGAEGQRTAFELWLEKQRERGWQAEAATVEMTAQRTSPKLAPHSCAQIPANGRSSPEIEMRPCWKASSAFISPAWTSRAVR